LQLNDNDSQESSEEWDSDDSDFIPQDQRTNRRRNVDEQVGIKLNKIPNMLICFCRYSHPFKFNLFFPEVYLQRRKDKTLKQLAFLSRSHRIQFIDDVFLPSVKRILENSLFNKLHSSYAVEESKGFQNGGSQFIMAGHFNDIVAEMRRRISRHRSLKHFKDFFFITTAFGGKQIVDFAEDGSLDHTVIDLSDLDWDQLQDQLSNVKIDFGIDFDFSPNNGYTFFLESDPTTRKRFDHLYQGFCEKVVGEDVAKLHFATQ
jgi:hypothetical protein